MNSPRVYYLNNPKVEQVHSSKDLQKVGSTFFPASENLFRVNNKNTNKCIDYAQS